MVPIKTHNTRRNHANKHLIAPSWKNDIPHKNRYSIERNCGFHSETQETRDEAHQSSSNVPEGNTSEDNLNCLMGGLKINILAAASHSMGNISHKHGDSSNHCIFSFTLSLGYV